ncbi:hypothetical protein B0T21DRAFT_424459 [Apiosordaria backusii]|uniref:Uncharacterized protein n=1 Tax=Apiosordaria backusii TaxID=314023 RepID=A0AA40E279_9PEZI|nr:hypothetical protein B0T21DRAFT_424459 [Apiosordaria backusii]
MIAAGELDRLSFLADDMAKSKKKNERETATATHNESVLTNEMLSPGSAASHTSGVPPNTPSQTAGSGTPPSATPSGGLSRSILSLSSGQGDFVPFPPANTPVFVRSGTASPIPGSASPVPGSSNRSGPVLGSSPVKQRAAGPSKLSEVHSFETAARRQQSRSDSPPTPRPQEKEEEPIYRLESFPKFPDAGDLESVYTSGSSTPTGHRAGAHYFVASSDLGSGGAAGLRLKDHTDCEEKKPGNRAITTAALHEDKSEQEEEVHAVDCRPDTWTPEDGEPGDGDVFCLRGESSGSRLSFATAAERRKSWLEIARRATKGRFDHELEECRGLTVVEGEGEEGNQGEGEAVVGTGRKRKHTIADIVELLRMVKTGTTTQK